MRPQLGGDNGLRPPASLSCTQDEYDVKDDDVDDVEDDNDTNADDDDDDNKEDDKDDDLPSCLLVDNTHVSAGEIVPPHHGLEDVN